MASPKTMWSGMIELGLLNIPITIGKASSDQKEVSFHDVVVTPDGEIHEIDRRWRDAVTGELCAGMTRQAVKIESEDGVTYRLIDESELDDIEAATKLPTLKVIDVEPLSKLPMLYSNQAYYVRHDPKSKAKPDALATLVATMMTERLALVVKWANESRQKLCVISAEQGILVLRRIPFLEDVRRASDREREHMKVKVEPKAVERMGELLREIQNPNGFNYADLHDEGLALRQAAVDRVLSGEKPKKKKAPEQIEGQTDIFEAIERAVADARKEKVET